MYSTLLYQSNSLIDAFEPQRADLNVLGVSEESTKAFIKALIVLANAFEVIDINEESIAELVLDRVLIEEG